MLRALLVTGLGLSLLSGCSKAPDATPEVNPYKNPLGSNCSVDGDCTSDFCLPVLPAIEYANGICSQACSSNADCSGELPTCGEGLDGSKACVWNCSGFHRGFACASGQAVACGKDEGLCEECGCGDGQRCQPGVGCLEKSGVGGPCLGDTDCKTGNCSRSLDVCRVPIGSACTADNCDACETGPDGYSFCSGACPYGGCGSNGECLYDKGSSVGFCYQRCSGSSDRTCPGTCSYSGGSVPVTYCKCEGACSYAKSVQKRPFGAACSESAECESGSCYHDCALSSCVGLCTSSCTQSSDCGEESACVDVACVDADSPCGTQCLPRCTVGGRCRRGSCRQLVELGTSTSVAVCDIKLANDSRCQRAGQCQSGVCFMGACVAAGADKNPNGGSCTSGSDCQSNNCVAGRCRGLALLDDSCASDVDCSVGTCCLTGDHAFTCRSYCP